MSRSDLSGKAGTGVRFAPSPTGRFHLGNLRTAWISREWALALAEPWVVRFEDIDRPRVQPGARESQLADLAALGMKPDVVYLQSDRFQRHWKLFVKAVREGAVYPCTCSRKEVQEALAGMASAPHAEPPIYNGRCRVPRGTEEVQPAEASHPTIAWRFRAGDESGARDIIIARTESLSLELAGFAPAYHWACAIDDWDGNYRVLVRAWDLESATPHQREIQSWLGARGALPAVYHTALVTTDSGGRLEKRTRGVTWPELSARGMRAEQLIESFRRSWEKGDFSPASQIGGECRRAITLSDLGIGVVIY